jgi:hypothetical protein
MISRRKSDSLVFMVVLVLVFIMAARTPLDSDLWWHIRSGEQTLQGGVPILRDVFSYTRAGEVWINHSWLSQVGIALLFRAGGWLALGAAMALAVTASVMLAWPQMRGAAFWRASVILLGCLVSAPVWTPRPQLASFFLFSLLAYLLYRYKWKGEDTGVWIPPVFLVWSNLHGGYALGAMLIACLLAGEALNHLFGRHGAEVVSWKRLGRLAGWSLLGGVLILVNPNGLDMWRIPFQTVGVGALQQFIQEWASPNFHAIELQPMLWMMFAIIIAVGLSGKQADATDLLSVVVFGYGAFLAQRNVGPFALVGMPVLARYGWLALNNGRESAEQVRRTRPKWQRRLNLALVGLLAVAGFGKLYLVTQPNLVAAYSQETNPVKAMEYIRSTQPAGRMFNEYNYLIWALPEYPVFVDGRTDLFGDEIISQWIEVVQGSPTWQDSLRKWQVGFILLPPDRPLVQMLTGNGWIEVYRDEVAVVFVRTP